MSRLSRLRPLFIGAALPAFLSYAAQAADVSGSKDHPLVSRYAGSEILKYEAKEFDSFAFTAVYQCENLACGNDFSYAFNPPSIMHFSGKDQKYLAARLSRSTGDIYVSVYTTAAYGVGGANKNRVFTLLDVVEVQPMQAGMVQVDASAMAREIAANGRVALYGIYFDSGKADVKPESGAALVEIAKLLKQDAKLRLLVVGHTDNAGAFDYNLDLSQRRAESVVQSLVAQHAVSASRLKPWGVGYTSPVASNSAEETRAKNRRVELVAW